jgi:cytochrome bd-type quinol oxidase subunit 2
LLFEMNVFTTDHPLASEPTNARRHRQQKLRSWVRRFLLFVGCASFLIGGWIFLYDLHFIQRHGFDANEVMSEIEAGQGVVDWETGMRPIWADYPAWIYGVVFWLIAFAAFALFALTKSKGNSNAS